MGGEYDKKYQKEMTLEERERRKEITKSALIKYIKALLVIL